VKILKIIKFIFLLLIVLSFGIIIENYIVLDKKEQTLPIIKSTMTKEKIQHDTEVFQSSIGSYIGKDIKHFIKKYGNPKERYKSAYDYDWLVYNLEHDIIYIGVNNNTIVTAFVTGSTLNVEPFELGESQEKIFQRMIISAEVSIKLGENTYQMELSENELMSKPITKIDNTWIQLYFDKLTGKLIGLRYMQPDILIKQKPFEIVYVGDLIKPRTLVSGDWLKVDDGNEKQILSISNFLRTNYGLNTFERDVTLDNVAYKHSEDMLINSFFDHKSPTNGNLENRLISNNVQFALAGENIASKYVDGIDVTFGWLNSENHRVNLLNPEFNKIGIGVIKDHFTQELAKK
jgi:uncharacterized protein YkwD